MTEPKKILYVHSGDNWIAGSERVLLDIVESLDRERFRAYAVCNSALLKEEFVLRGVPTQVFPLATLLLYGGHNPLRYLRSVAEIVRQVRAHRIDLIHATSGLSAQYCVPAARITGVPVLSHVQGTHLKSSRVASLITLADHVVSVSHSIATDYVGAGHRLSVLYNGIDTGKYAPNPYWRAELRRELQVSEDELVVGSSAQLIRRKRPDFFVEAAALIRKAYPGVRFVMAGGGPLRDELEAQARANSLSESFLMLGFRNDIEKVLCAFDLFLFTSEGEALPLAPLEAASSGLPVVAGDTVGLCEVVRDGVTGYLVNPRRVEDYAERVIHLLRDRIASQEMGAAGRGMVLSDFSMEAFRINVRRLYGRIFGDV